MNANSMYRFISGLTSFCVISTGYLRSILLVAILGAGFHFSSSAQLNIVATTSSSTTAASLTFSHNRGAAANTITLVSVQLARQTTLSSITYGGNNMTLVGESSDASGSGRRATVYIYSILNAPTGAQNIVINVSGTNGIVAGATSFSNVNASAPLRAYTGSNGTSANDYFTANLNNVATGPGEIVFSAISYSDGTINPSYGSGQTGQWNLKTSTADDDRAKGAASTKPISSGSTTSISYGGLSDSWWGAGAVSVRPATLSVSATVTNASCANPTGGAINQTVTGNAPFTFSWSNGANTEDISGLSAGTYSVTITDATNASITASYTVTGPSGSGPDTDGDGVADSCDQDDDNDGILDVNECSTGNFFWSNAPTISGNTATGTINGVNYTYTSSQPVLSTPDVYQHSTFPTSYNVPNVNPTVRNELVTNNVLTFSAPVINPVLVFASIGNLGLNVPISFSDPVTVLWSQNVVQNSSTQITGNEGYAIVQLTGTFSSVSFNYLAAEGYCNFVFGANFAAACDTDGDGLVDALDTDSDNDGCADAIEGGANFTAANINASGRLTGGVNATTGIPTVAGAGQTVGQSQVATQLTVITAPANQTVATGAAASFSIATTASNNTSWSGPANARVPVYGTPGNANAQTVHQWYLGNPDAGGTALTNTGVYSGVTTATLNISNSTGLTGSQYFVVVTHSNNSCIREVRSATLLSLCTPGAGNPDADGDGVADICDQDDDNDGILDTAEGTTVVPGGVCLAYDFNTTAQGWVQQNDNAGGTFALTHSSSAGTINGCSILAGAPGGGNYIFEDDLTAGAIYFESPDNLNTNLSNAVGGSLSYWWINGIRGGGGSQVLNAQTIVLTGGGISVTASVNITNEINTGWKNKTIPLTDAVWSGSAADLLTVLSDLDRIEIQVEDIFSAIWGGDCNTVEYFGLDELRITCASSSVATDTDGDGIPNALDTDSDNDGCPDAIEGGANFTAANINGSGSLTGGVNATTGIPTVAGAGQTVGQSQVATQLAVTTAPANQLVSPGAAASFSVATTASNNTSWSGPTNARVPVYGTPGNANAQTQYQWWLGNPSSGGTQLTNAGVYSGVTTATLNISNSLGLSGNVYYVVVTHSNNSCIREVRNATLTLLITAPDFNAGLVGQPIPGNVSTNDQPGGTYGNPAANPGNPSASSPTVNANGTYTFTTNIPGVYTFNVPVCPPGQSTGCPTERLTITVTNPAVTTNPPVANTDIATTANNTPVTIPVRANDGPGNVGGSLGTPTLVGANGGAANGTVTINGSGNAVYTPNPGFSGTDVFTYQVCETPGGLCATATVKVTVLPAGAVNTTSAADDYAATIGTVPVTGNVKTNDIDPEGNTTTVTPQTNVAVTGGTFSVTSTGAYTFTPTAGFVGTVNIPYTVCDNGTPQACASASLHVTVRGLPATAPDFNAGLVGQPIPGNVSTNDQPGGTYGNPAANPGNPSTSSPTVNANGTYTFTTNIPGVYLFNVPVCPPGQSAGCPTERLTITVTNPAVTTNPPVANTDIATTANNTPVTIPVRANDGPGNVGGTLGTPTLVGANGGAANGTVTINGSGNAVYTPNPGFSGTDVFTYQVCETPSGLCATATVKVTVLPAGALNTTSAADDYTSTTGVVPVTGNVKTNDIDPEGNTTTVTPQTNVAVTGGTFSVTSTGAYTFTPTAGFVGTVNIPYTVCDNGTPQACASASLHVTVRGLPATAPDFNAGLVGQPIPGNVSTNDQPGGTYGNPAANPGNPSTSSPTVNANGTYTFTTNIPGVYTFNVPVCPPGQSTGCPTERLTITVTNPAVTTNPPVANTDIATTANNTPVTIPVRANDGPGNAGGSLGTPTLVGANGGAANGTVTINGSGNAVYTPNPGFSGTDVFTYQVCETPGGLCATATVKVTVLPAGAVNTTSAADDYTSTTGVVPATGNVKTNDIDPEGNTTTVTPQTNVAVTGGTFSVTSTGAYTFTPTAGFVGTVNIPYTVCDNGTPQACASASLHVTVRGLPATAPDFNAGLVGQPIPGNVSTNDQPGGTYGNPAANPGNPSASSPTVNANGTYTFTTNIPGVYTFDVPVCPPGQSAGCPTEKLTITVTNPAVTTNPPVANTDIATTANNTPVTIPVRANDGPGNVGGSLGTPTLVGANGGAANGTVTINGSGNAVYTPNPGFSGTDVFTYQVCETPGGLCATATVKVTVLPAGALNTTSAADDYAATTGTVPVTGNVKTNDIDPEGNTTTVTPQTNVAVTGGTFSVTSTGAYTFTPTAGFVGTVNIPYTVCDNGAPQACASASLHVVVKAVPATAPDFNAGLVGQPIPGNVSTNDQPGGTYGNPAANPGNPSTASPTVNANGTYTFTTNVAGVYTFDVPVCPPGQSAGCPTEKLTITVTNPAVATNPPVANTDIATTPNNTPVTIPIRANDGPGNVGGTLGTPTLVGANGAAANGTVTINGSGNAVYTPNPGFSGSDVFTYQVCETPSGLCATATVKVTVLPAGAVNTTSAADDYASTTGVVPATGNVKTNDIDPEGNTTTVTPQTNVAVTGGTFSVTSTGAYTFTPTAGFTGTVNIPYTVCDDGAPQACASASLHIAVATGALPDLTPSQFFTSQLIQRGDSVDILVGIRNIGIAPTSDVVEFSITRYTAGTGITATLNANSSFVFDGDTYNLSLSEFDVTVSALRFNFKSKPGVVINPGESKFFAVTLLRSATNSNGNIFSTIGIVSGTGGGETPTTNNIITNTVSKN